MTNPPSSCCIRVICLLKYTLVHSQAGIHTFPENLVNVAVPQSVCACLRARVCVCVCMCVFVNSGGKCACRRSIAPCLCRSCEGLAGCVFTRLVPVKD